MKKKLIAICLSAFMFTSVTSINCMAENPYPDEEVFTVIPVLLFYRISLEKMTVRQASLFWVISDMMPRPKKILDYTNQEDYVASYPFLKNGTVVDAGGYEVFASYSGFGLVDQRILL